LGNGPHTAHQFAGNRDDDLVGMVPPGREASKAFTQPPLGLPADILHRLGEFFETALEMAADLGRRAVGPGPFNQRSAGLGIPRLGQAALTTGLTTGIFRRGEPPRTPELSGGSNAGEVAEFCYHGHGHGERHPT
jgi:hypothetical protein